MRARLLIVWVALACASPADGGQAARAADTATTVAATLSPFARAKAEALLRDRLPCLGCHRIGATGGTMGPDLTTVATRRSRAEIERMIRDPQGSVPGTAMPRVPMPDDWVALLSGYLGGTGPSAAAAPRATPVSSGLPAATLYARFCASCHGGRGAGDGPNAANLPVPPARHADPAAMARRPDDSLYDAIAGGGWIMGKSPTMPPFGATLAPDDINGLVAYIRELCRCAGPQWSRDGRRGAAG